jgi:hypothetical protein
VRPEYHRQFIGKTGLVALESQSRNIAVRRANPSNRWILSTNPDMVFVLRDSWKSLSQIAAEMPDGFFHLPRFEVPENLWEILDRRAPQDVIATIREWGRRFHLNEIVLGGYDNIYEAPGDFQLFLKDDFETIAGFDETMILGWHADTNVARRMKLLRGRVDTAVNYVFGYHCGHTRQATSLHSHARTENSLDTYVKQVTEAVCHAQRESWGAPHWDFEERRLGRDQQRLAITPLARVLREEGPLTSEVALHVETYCGTTYSSDHVLPHLYNLVGELPPRRKFVFFGNDEHLLGPLAALLGEAGLEPTVIVPETVSDAIFERVRATGVPTKQAATPDALSEADFFVLQYPAADVASSDQQQTLQWQCLRAFEAIAEVERQRPLRDRRLLIVVNGTHTRMQDHLLANMSFTSIPYTARLRHGYINDEPADPEAPLRNLPQMPRVCELLGRIHPLLPAELQLFRELFAFPTQEGLIVSGWERLAVEIEALTGDPLIASSLFGLSPSNAATINAQAKQAVSAAAARCAVVPEHVGPRVDVATRLCSPADWEDEVWRKSAWRLFAGWHSYGIPARARWHWERLSLLHTLLSEVPPGLNPRVLVVSNWREPLGAYAAYHGYQVVQASLEELETGQPSDVDHAAGLDVWNLIDPVNKTADWGEPFDAVLILGCMLSGLSPTRLDSIAARLGEISKPDALVGASLLVHLNNAEGGGAMKLQEWRQIFAPQGAFGRLGWCPVGEVDVRIPLQTAVRFALEDTATPVPGLSFGWSDAIVTAGAAVARLGATPSKMAVRRSQRSAVSALEDAAQSLRNRIVYARVIAGLRRSVLPLAKGSAEDVLGQTGPSPGLAAGSSILWCAIGLDAIGLKDVRLCLHSAGLTHSEIQGARFFGEHGSLEGSIVSQGSDAIVVHFHAVEQLGRGIAIIVVHQPVVLADLTIE